MGDSREVVIDTFLNGTNWANSLRHPLPQDASFRRYWRLSKGNESIMLMDAPPPEKPVRLFAEIALFLKDNGLYAPQICDMDDQNGLLLLEDFGEDTYTRILKRDPRAEYELYDLAIDTLVKLHQFTRFENLSLADYDNTTLIAEARLFIEWYYPSIRRQPATTRQITSFERVWQNILEALPTLQPVVVLRDYHVDNLMRVTQAGTESACGLLDFQDALIGSPAYDLISLIEDARRDVSVELKQRCLKRYFYAMSKQENGPSQDDLTPWLNVLAAQRHAKVLGIFVRLRERDGKNSYIEHLPRVEALFRDAIHREPLLGPLNAWMTENIPL